MNKNCPFCGSLVDEAIAWFDARLEGFGDGS